MKFYCIASSEKKNHNQECVNFLQQACERRGLEFIQLDAATFDYGKDRTTMIETPSIVYRIVTTKSAALLEALLVRDGVATLYSDPAVLYRRMFPWGALERLERASLPVIPTVLNVSMSQDEHLAGYIEKLGGFPVILKGSGGSHGASVLRLDSMESLRSVLGYVTSDKTTLFALRKFIHAATHLRMVVVGDKVVDAIRYFPQPDDFRTNAVATPKVEPYARTDENERYFAVAAEAVKALGLEFGGVDLLIDEAGEAYIAEVNFPCNFARNQMTTGFDVAGAIVDHLFAKTRQ
jgi:RimK family alpha-L-glutamate ligase